MSRRSRNFLDIPPIPKVIHQIWLPNWSQVPSHIRQTRANWVTLNPTWNYRFWGLSEIEELIEHYLPQLTETWEKLGEDRIIKRCDLARLIVLYIYGGLYADMDLNPVLPLRINSNFTDRYIGCAELTMEGEERRICNGFIGAPIRSPVIFKMISECADRLYHPVLEFLGPKVVSAFLLPERTLVLPWYMVLSNQSEAGALCHNLDSRSWGESEHGDEWYRC